MERKERKTTAKTYKTTMYIIRWFAVIKIGLIYPKKNNNNGNHINYTREGENKTASAFCCHPKEKWKKNWKIKAKNMQKHGLDGCNLHAYTWNINLHNQNADTNAHTPGASYPKISHNAHTRKQWPEFNYKFFCFWLFNFKLKLRSTFQTNGNKFMASKFIRLTYEKL